MRLILRTLLTAAKSSSKTNGLKMDISPEGIKPAGVLAAVKARPLGVRASGMLWVPAGLDGVCARSAAVIRGRGEGRACGAVEQGNETTDRVEGGFGPINRSLGRVIRLPGRALVGVGRCQAREPLLRSGDVSQRSGCSRSRGRAASRHRRCKRRPDRRGRSGVPARWGICVEPSGLLVDVFFGAEALALDDHGIDVVEDAVEDGGG